MKLRFREAVVWKHSIMAISKVIEEANFKISRDGLRLRAMDPSGVVLVDFHIPSDAFSEFEAPDEEVIIGLNTSELAKVLKRAKKGDELVLETRHRDRLDIYLEGRGSRRFSLPSIELSYQEIPEIDIEETFKCKILPRVFKDVIRELEPISDSVELYSPINSDTLYVRARGDIAEAEVVLSASSGMLAEYESRDEARSKYTLKYLRDILTAAYVAELLSLGFGVETPLRMGFDISGGGLMLFYVAPRTD